MRREVLNLLLLGTLSATVKAQGAPPPDYTKAQIVTATETCLAAFVTLEADSQRFPIQEFGVSIYATSSDPEKEALDAFTSCVRYQLENQDAEVVPLT